MADPIPFPDAARQLAMRGSFLDLFYGTLFQPWKTFQGLASAELPGNKALFYALLSVLLISGMAPVVQMAHMGGKPTDLALTIPLSAVGGFIVWIWVAGMMALSAYALIGRSRLRMFLVLSGLSMLPAVLLGPISLLNIGMAGVLICAIPAMLVWLWTSLLFTLAVMSTYDITADRAIILLCLPVLLMFTGLGACIGFIGTLLQFRAG
jgi:Yip1 domain